ncbi:MAG TPA: hypothetical protein VHO70_23460, partial [Chitinispirillaceae bacterium]|nr:hypothetical protein [Chitinispirillaceae bacterium]
NMDYATQKTAAAPVSQPIMAGSIGEGIVGGGAVVLAILGLISVYPLLLLSVAVIVVGAAFLIQGTTVVSRFSKLLSDAWGGQGNLEISGGMNAEFFGGITGVVLGILALIGVAPLTLISISAIVYGATLIASGSTSSRLLALLSPDNLKMNRIMQESANNTTSVDIMVGLGAISLGILSLVGFIPLTLNLVAVLAVGAVILMSGSAIGSKMAGR